MITTETQIEQDLINKLTELKYSYRQDIREPREMMEENKNHFRSIFRWFIAHHSFSPVLFPKVNEATA
jgi:hypothetical protein